MGTDGAGISPGLTGSELTQCERIRKQIMEDGTNTFIPRCDQSGAYQPEQCDETGDCWCVQEDGSVIEHSKRAFPDRPYCNHNFGEHRACYQYLSPPHLYHFTSDGYGKLSLCCS